MSSVVLYMSMSADGYIAGPNDNPDNPGGDEFDRLHEWMWTEDWKRKPGPATDFGDEGDRTGALIAGRRTVEQINHWNGDNHNGVPIFVVSHRPPDPEVTEKFPLVHYVTDIETAVKEAKEAAGDQDVLMHGAYVAQRALEAGVLDEIQIHQVPVLFGGGLRLFETLPARIELEIVRVIDTPEATHIRYRVVR
jgi:dihydrofolate reductase